MWTGEESEREKSAGDRCGVSRTDPEASFVRVMRTRGRWDLKDPCTQEHLTAHPLATQGVNYGFGVFPSWRSQRHTGILHY